MPKNTKISARRWLLIPVETKAREFHAKILFGCFAAIRGWGGIIGPRRVIRKQQVWLPKGVLVEKSASAVDVQHMRNTSEHGNRLVAWDEEGLLYFCREDYIARRVNKDALECLEHFFCWGGRQLEDLSSGNGFPTDRFLATGHPRVDVLRPEFREIFRNDSIRKKVTPYILINTKFGTILPADKYSEKYNSYIEWLKASGRCNSAEEETRLGAFIDLQEKTLVYYRELIPALSSHFPKHRIILRPHPSESNAFWLEETRGLRNVHVMYEGSANEWIYAADAMIHSNCTTGVEAYLLGKPPISYLPVRAPGVECELANALSIQTFSLDETLEAVSKYIQTGASAFDLSGRDEVAAQYIEALSGPFASERILDAIENLDLVKPMPFAFPDRPSFCRQAIGTLISNLRSEQNKKPKENKRFPGIKKSEVAALMYSLKNQYAPFRNVNFEDMGQDTFCFYKHV